MKDYRLYVFTQSGCGPCEKLAAHLDTLSPDERKELTLVPMRHIFNRQRTPLAIQFKVDKSPTLVVAYEQMTCCQEAGEDEACEAFELPLEKIEGAKAIIKALPNTLSDYTYVYTE